MMSTSNEFDSAEMLAPLSPVPITQSSPVSLPKSMPLPIHAQIALAQANLRAAMKPPPATMLQHRQLIRTTSTPQKPKSATKRRKSSRSRRQDDDTSSDEEDGEDDIYDGEDDEEDNGQENDDDSTDSPKKSKNNKQQKPQKSKTKWSEYLAKIRKLLTSRKKWESKGLYEEVLLISQEIKEIIQNLVNENSSHVRYPEIANDEGFNVDNITCSKCHEPDSESNDLYFCDNIGCNRVYHRQCLEPPLSYNEINSNPDEDWFCHQCTCVAECLLAINRSCKTNFMTPEEFLAAELPTNKSLTAKEEKKTSSGRKSRRSGGSAQKVVPLEISYTESGPSLVYAPNSFWGQTYTLIKRLVGDIVRYNHFVTVFSTQSQPDVVVLTDDLQRYSNLLRRRKMQVREALATLIDANRQHTKYTQLDQNDEDGMVDVGEILCSKCGGSDTENNDIFICDRKGCCRAYHAYCLDPPLTPTDISNKPDEDWFCWECRCLADCLVVINEALGTTYDGDSTEVFAEVLQEVHDNPLQPEDEEEDDDQEYTPKNRAAEEAPAASDHESDDAASESSSEDVSSADHEDDDDADKNDSEVSEDEIHHLLAEAGAEIMDVRSPTSSKDLISSRLRKKTPKSSDKSSLPQGMTPVSKLKESDIKEEFPVAIVKGGKFVLGEVKSISPGHPIRYTILFEDDSEEIVSWALLRERYKDRLDYESYVQKAEASKISSFSYSQNVLPDELISTENIIKGRRTKPRLDYAKLLEEVFGDQPESEDDDDDYYSDEDGKLRRSDSHKKHPKQPSQLHSPAVVINTVYVPPPPVTQSAPSFTPRHHILGSGPPQPPPVVPNPQLSLAGKRKERSDMIEDLMLGTEDESDKRMKITAVDFDSI